MESICLYTIVHSRSGITDYTTNPNYADRKAREGYIVTADLIKRPIIYRGRFNG